MKKSNKLFSVHSSFNPMGDQVNSIESLSQGILAGIKHQALKGATGTGKTYVLAKVLERLSQLEGKPRSVLVLSPNKTLAAQLFQEFKDFFPENAVTYFVSYYDYYQPESYLPAYDRLIEKESSINDEIDRYRNETTRTLIEREDVVVVASVSCIYGLGTPEYYESLGFSLRVGEAVPREEVIRRLVDIQYERNDQVVNRGNFRARGDRIELYPSYEWNIIQIDWLDDRIESIKTIDTLNRSVLEEREQFLVFPAKHHVMPDEILSQGLETIGQELDNRIAELNEQGKIIEIQRLRTRTTFDLEMLKTTGYCPGIENYSAHFDGRIRQPDYKCLEIPPNTLLDFFPENFLLIVDESHVALPQVQGMIEGDKARKKSLVDYGFRLKSAYDNRPLTYKEFFQKLSQIVYVSATLGNRELELAKDGVVDQVIRPTGLLDPEIVVKPTQGQIDDLMDELRQVVSRNERALVTTLTKKMAEHLAEYLQDAGFKAQYLHSDINTLERNKILRDLRLGEFDILIGINLLREGLDLPEVSLVAIFDADKEGFLRSSRSLIQIVGRASRNVRGRAVMYADMITPSMKEAIGETNRRREIQENFNKSHGITPRSVVKSIKEYGIIRETSTILESINDATDDEEFEELITGLQKAMREYAEKLEFERAAKIRDQVAELRAQRASLLAKEV